METLPEERPSGMPLYVRLWLAVVLAVMVLTVVFGWLWRINAEQQQQPPLREVVIRNEAGEVLGQANARVVRVPGQGVEFQVNMLDGSVLLVQLAPRPRRPPDQWRPWARDSEALLWTLGIVAVAVAIGAYPVVRRLTQRLENLRGGVERWGEGDLSVRVPVRGNDEVAFLARRFNHAAERVEALVKSHKSLLANASHELRSPLTRIRMGLELMGERPSPAARQEISRNIGELDQLIDEILLASRLDAREADMGTEEQVDLVGLAAEECARAGAELDLPPQGGEVVVHGVSRLLRRVVRNLLENARRYGEGSEASVRVQKEGPYAVVRVFDRGPGVPSELRERIFEPFYRLPGASERDGGVGLGLALVRSIAQRHGGTARCESREGGGACFIVELPT